MLDHLAHNKSEVLTYAIKIESKFTALSADNLFMVGKIMTCDDENGDMKVVEHLKNMKKEANECDAINCK